jgi:hypothetical protein
MHLVAAATLNDLEMPLLLDALDPISTVVDVDALVNIPRSHMLRQYAMVGASPAAVAAPFARGIAV